MTTVLCTRCGKNQVLAPTSIEEDPMCEGCYFETHQVTHYDYYLAMTNAHDLRHPDRPVPGNLPVPNTPIYEFNNDEGGCKGFEDSCDNQAEGDDDFCLDCHRKMAESMEKEQREAQEGTTFFATLATPGCPGYGTGEDCGNPKLPGGDLCGDCHMARCDAESPRIPH